MLILNGMGNELEVVIDIIILHMLKNIRNIFLAALPITLFVVMINLLNQLFLTGKKCSQY